MVDQAGLLPTSGMESSPGEMQGLGWKVFPEGKRLYYQHAGGGPGFAAIMRLYPAESLAFVVMANGTILPDKSGLIESPHSGDYF